MSRERHVEHQPSRDGSDLRNQMCATGTQLNMPMRSRRTFDRRHFDAAFLANHAAVL